MGVHPLLCAPSFSLLPSGGRRFPQAAYAAVGWGKPQLTNAKTVVGKVSPEVSGTDKAHGECAN